MPRSVILRLDSPVAVLAGLTADLLLNQLKPSGARPGALRFFALAVPSILYLFYFLDLAFTTGIPWSIHLWLGSTFMAGIVGLLLSYLWVPLSGSVEHSVDNV